MEVTRQQVLAFRLARHQLDGRGSGAPALLDHGVQDTGPDGSAWALVVRGAEPLPDRRALLAWTLRGAPHLYRRKDAAAVAVATAPWSEADAGKRIFDASSPLNKAGIPILEALVTVAEAMRSIVTEPMVKGELSTRLTEALPKPFLRDCRVCKATHAYEQPFRIAALQAGLGLQPGTSPPVLERIDGLEPLYFSRSGSEARPTFGVVRSHLRFFGPLDAKAVATYVDGAQRDLKAGWPEDVVDVTVEGTTGTRSILEADADALTASGALPDGVRLLGPYDPYLQVRDRELLVPDASARKDLWRTIGRPGALLVDGELAGSWRAKKHKAAITVTVTPWTTVAKANRAKAGEEAEGLADFRDLDLAEVVWDD